MVVIYHLAIYFISVENSSDNISSPDTCSCKYERNNDILLKSDRDIHYRVNDKLNNKTYHKPDKGANERFYQ